MEGRASNIASTDEFLVFLLRYIIGTHKADASRSMQVNASKPATKTEIYKRLYVVKDMLHSNYSDSLHLETVSKAACLSVPQLIRQFKAAFGTTPHQYLVNPAAATCRRTNKAQRHTHTRNSVVLWL